VGQPQPGGRGPGWNGITPQPTPLARSHPNQHPRDAPASGAHRPDAQTERCRRPPPTSRGRGGASRRSRDRDARARFTAPWRGGPATPNSGRCTGRRAARTYYRRGLTRTVALTPCVCALGLKPLYLHLPSTPWSKKLVSMSFDNRS
jgi:hypothetical protein